MKTLLFLSICLVILLLPTGLVADATEDNITVPVDNTNDRVWIDQYISIDETDDIFAEVRLSRFIPDEQYVAGLTFRQRLQFGIDAYDRLNLRQNSNVLPRFPYVIMLYGGYSSNRAVDMGVLFRADNLANSRVVLTAATSFGSRTGNRFLLAVEYPAILREDRLRLFGNIGVHDTSSAYLLQEKSLTFDNFNPYGWGYSSGSVGFKGIFGASYRIPKIEMAVKGSLDFDYRHDYAIRDASSDVESSVSINNFGINITVGLDWNRQKQTNTIPVGNDLSVNLRFLIPTTLGTMYSTFRFQSIIDERFSIKFYREFALRVRGIVSCNYGVSYDYAGDPYVRGLVDQELTGWFALLASVELLLPLIHVDMKSALSINFKQDARFILYWAFFLDGGFTIEDFNNPLFGQAVRAPRTQINNSLDRNNPDGQAYLGNGHYLLPALSVGTGVRIYPWFLPFIIRFDASCNILKAAIYQDPARCFELTLSFSEAF